LTERLRLRCWQVGFKLCHFGHRYNAEFISNIARQSLLSCSRCDASVFLSGELHRTLICESRVLDVQAFVFESRLLFYVFFDESIEPTVERNGLLDGVE
jgi:hypothetical protein